MADKVTAVARRPFAGRAESLFDAWLDEGMVRRWLAEALRAGGLPGDITEVSIREDGFVWADQRGETEARHWGTFREVARPGRLVFTWSVEEGEADPSVVTLEIGAGEARIEHGLDAEWADYVPRVEASWGRMLEASIKLVGDRAT